MKTNEILKQLRRSKKLTQADMSACLGISLSSYQKYEREKGTVIPSLDVLIKIADFYNVSTDYLLGRSISEGASLDCIDELALKYNLSDTEKRFLNTYLALPNSMRSDLMQFLKIATHEA